MWSDSQLRIVELLDIAKFFELEGSTGTAAWIGSFAKHLSTRKPVADLEKDFEELFNTFQSEFRRGDAMRGLILEIIRVIVFAALKSKDIRERLLELQPLFQEVVVNSKNIEFIITPFLPYQERGDHKMQYYGMCVHYLFYAEGVFDVAVRIVYALASVAAERPVAFEEVNEMPLAEVRRRLQDSLGIPAGAFFPGWENGRVRNAVAHLRFSYDDVSQKMRFRDIETKQRGPYDKSLTISEFRELSSRLMDPWRLIQNLFIILRIQQLVFHMKVDPPPGKHLIFN